MPAVNWKLDHNIAVLEMNHGSANAIDRALAEDLLAATRAIAAESAARAVLFTSAKAKFFSPGLDVLALYDLDRRAMRGFFDVFTAAYSELYALPKPVVCAIGGHAVAGGMVLTLCADYRIMADGASLIGLNELQIGVALPYGVIRMLTQTVPPRTARHVAYFGKNYSPREALELGLLDEVTGADEFPARCREAAARFAAHAPGAFAATKDYLRRAAVADMLHHESAATEQFLDVWFSPETRARIEALRAKLKK